MTSLDQLREMLRSGTFGDDPKPVPKQAPKQAEAAPSKPEAPKKSPATENRGGKAGVRDKMTRMDMMGKPDKRRGGKRFKKLYIIDMLAADLREGETTQRWEVWASWGRAGAAMNEKCLLSTTNKTKANRLYRQKINEKLDKGYNIESQTGDHT